MQHALPDFLGSALVPELASDIATCTPGDIHGPLVGVAAVGALPDQLAILFHNFNLAIPTAFLAIIALRIQFGVDDVVVYEPHYSQDRFDIVLHVGHFHITDGSAWRQELKLGFQGQLAEGINGLRHMNVIAIGDVVAVADTRHFPESALERLGKLVGRAFNGGAIHYTGPN